MAVTATPQPTGLGGVLAGTYTPPASTTTTAAGATAVPANATAPVWQPWVQTQSQALSVLKTQITAALADFNAAQSAAQRVLDGAAAIAAEQARQLEAAAWVAYHKYMDQAAEINNAVMDPALAAYTAAMQTAHTRLLARLNPVQHAYAQVASDAGWVNNLTTGHATIGSG